MIVKFPITSKEDGETKNFRLRTRAIMYYLPIESGEQAMVQFGLYNGIVLTSDLMPLQKARKIVKRLDRHFEERLKKYN